MGKTYLSNDPGYFSVAPEDLEYARVGAEAMGYRSAIFKVGADEAENPPAVVMLYLPPGAVLPRHAHDCYRLEVVVQGSMQTEDGMWLESGDVRTSDPGEAYGPHTAGPTGVLSVEIFSHTAGMDAEFAPDLPPEHVEILARARAATQALARNR